MWHQCCHLWNHTQINLYIQGLQSDNYPRRTFHVMPHFVGGTFHTNSISHKYMTLSYRSFHRNGTPAVNSTSPYMTATHNTTYTENETKRNLTTCTTVCLRENVQHYDAAESTKTVPVDPAHFKINKVLLTLSQVCMHTWRCLIFVGVVRWRNGNNSTMWWQQSTAICIQIRMYSHHLQKYRRLRIIHLTTKQLTDLRDKHIWSQLNLDVCSVN